MKIFIFFLKGNKNCRVGTKKKQGRSGKWKHGYFLFRPDSLTFEMTIKKQIMAGIYQILKAESYTNDASIVFLYAFQ